MRSLLVVALAACVHNDHALVATLDRGACNGTCPTYTLYIYDDGVVEYIGSEFVMVRGSATTRLSDRQLSELDQLFAQANYFALGGSYETDHANDAPLIATSYTHGGRTKEIRHASSPDIPAALVAVEAGIDKIVHTARWIGTQEQRERHGFYK
jgi:hypothetical protein